MTTTVPIRPVSAIESDGLETRTETSNELQATPESQRAIAEIRGAILMARHFPRDVDGAIVNINRLCGRPRFADGAFYQFPRGGGQVEGPSVNLARGIAAEWGNIKYGKRVIRDDGDEIVIEAFAWDMQKNSYVTDQASFRNLVQRKQGGKTVWIKPDERDKRELVNKHGAIAERNCLLKILPRDVVDQAFDLCKNTARSGAKKDREESIRNMLTEFSSFGITKDQIEGWLAERREAEEADIRSISADEMVELKGVLTSIVDGNSSPSEYFKAKKGTGGLHEKGTLDTEAMKPGDAESNKGYDQAPKPSSVPDSEQQMRDSIIAVASSIAEGDPQKADSFIDAWMEGCGLAAAMTLPKCTGSSLRKLYDFSQREAKRHEAKSGS